ncbi:hypothetical protein BS47DRAFT_1344025 [Hydnum rufescens UP504]|uniref:FAD-binding domain-containing protein n=1 Tax=Hydnum rufescens UP504 TaxID=1448309 RepID=A0A9P6DSY9_9AGAM|nr:hypothetical protein BS47DRAFT_1344025 [Hydnum rufescens UP504]
MGSQGLNSSVQDSVNLAWKLSLVDKKTVSPLAPLDVRKGAHASNQGDAQVDDEHTPPTNIRQRLGFPGHLPEC